MGNFKFESEFTDVDDIYLKIYCKSENKSFTCLIDTYSDPYMIYYYPLNVLDKEEEEKFRDDIFDYLQKMYPTYF